MSNQIKTERNICVDAVKVAAIIGVMIIHASSPALAETAGGVNWFFGLFWRTAACGAVPLFLMCSGVLFLSPEKPVSIKKVFTRSIPRILAAMFFWGLIYKIWHLCLENNFSAGNLWFAVKRLLLFDQEFHFYYLHIILIVYIFLPVTSAFVKNADKKTLRYFLAVWFAFGILYPTLKPFHPFSMVGGITGQYHINMVYASIGYGVLGSYLHKYPPKPVLSAALFAVGEAAVFAGTAILSVRDGATNEIFLQGMSVGVCFAAAGAFGIICRISAGAGKKLSRVLVFISKGSFCVYLTHIFALKTFADHGFSALSFNRLFSIPAVALATFAVSLAAYFILSKIPFFNRWFI